MTKHPVAAVCAFALTVSLAGRAQGEPSFDCATAKQAAEQAICADPGLADLDRAIADSYAATRDRLDVSNAGALRADQRAWLADRNTGFARGSGNLKVEMQQRLKMLRTTYFAAYPFLGLWLNHSGSVLIKFRRGLIVSFSTDNCNNLGEPREVGDSIVLDAGAKMRDANGSVRITLRGPLLIVAEVPPKRWGKGKPQPICAGGGTIAGVYFPAGDR